MGGVTTRSNRRVWLLAALVVVAGIAGAVLVVSQRASDPEPEFCAGVGLVGSGNHPTAEEAFAAWLADNPPEPERSAWSSDGESERPNSGIRAKSWATDDSERYWSVTAGNGGTDPGGGHVATDLWQVDGACVRAT